MYYFLVNPDSVLGHIILSGLTRGLCSYFSKDFLLKLKLIEKIKYFLHENLNLYINIKILNSQKMAYLSAETYPK